MSLSSTISVLMFIWVHAINPALPWVFHQSGLSIKQSVAKIPRVLHLEVLYMDQHSDIFWLFY